LLLARSFRNLLVFWLPLFQAVIDLQPCVVLILPSQMKIEWFRGPAM
jgi:hypothetical protein